MGEVYRGRQVSLDREVAIKVMANATKDARLTREARLAARVSSPNAVPVYDFGVLPDGRALLLMELVRGRSLDAFIEEGGALPGARLARFMADAARGMMAVAEAGIVHRNLKPEKPSHR